MFIRGQYLWSLARVMCPHPNIESVAGGIDTHENIPSAELLLIDGMGHDLPAGAWEDMVTAISALTSKAKPT